MKYCAISDIGLTQQINQDGLYIDGHIAFQDNYFCMFGVTSNQEYIAAVFDGVGGTAYGELSVKFCIESLLNKPIPKNHSELSDMVNELNRLVNVEFNQNSVRTATTVAGIVVSAEVILAFNVGDSKVFVLNNGYLEQISTDDTLSSFTSSISNTIQVDNNQQKSPLIQYIGYTNNELDVHISDIRNSKQILICSDGLTDLIDIDTLEELFNNNQDQLVLSMALRNKALENGGTDNISFILIKLD